MITKTYRSAGYSHSVNFALEHGAYEAVGKETRQPHKKKLFWRGEKVEMSLIFCLIQIFTDKSHVPIISEHFVFYSLHISFLNFTKEVRRRHIS